MRKPFWFLLLAWGVAVSMQDASAQGFGGLGLGPLETGEPRELTTNRWKPKRPPSLIQSPVPPPAPPQPVIRKAAPTIDQSLSAIVEEVDDGLSPQAAAEKVRAVLPHGTQILRGIGGHQLFLSPDPTTGSPARRFLMSRSGRIAEVSTEPTDVGSFPVKVVHPLHQGIDLVKIDDPEVKAHFVRKPDGKLYRSRLMPRRALPKIPKNNL